MERAGGEKFEEPSPKRLDLRIKEQPGPGDAPSAPRGGSGDRGRVGAGRVDRPGREHAPDDLRVEGGEADDLRPRTDRGELALERRPDEDDHGTVRGFFQGLEEAVGSLLGEVIGIEDDRHLPAPEGRPQQDPPAEPLAHPVLTVADECLERDRGPVLRLLDDVDVGMTSGGGLKTGHAGPTGYEPRPGCEADKRPCQRLGKRPLADPLWPDEQIRAGDPASRLSGDESPDHVVMPLDALPAHRDTFPGDHSATRHHTATSALVTPRAAPPRRGSARPRSPCLPRRR